MRTARTATLVALAAFACQQDDRHQQSPTGLASHSYDSADIRITENARPPEDSRLPWRIGPEPTVSIGEHDGEEPYMLHWVGSVARLSDGRIMVGNHGSSEVRMFDASGNHLVSWGGEGEGPRRIPDLGPRRSVAGRLDRCLVLAGTRHLRLRFGGQLRPLLRPREW